jgi:hypothetical protein
MKILGIIGIILLCILAVPLFLVFLLLLLCSAKTRIKVKISPQEKELWISHLFWEKQLYPLPPREKKKKKESPEKEKSSSDKKSELFGSVKSQVKALTLSDYIEFVQMLHEGFIRRMRFEKLHLAVSVGTPSADLTAQRYGQLTAAVFPLLGRLDAAGKIKDGRVNISPDFLKEETEVLADVDVSLRIIHLFSWAIKVVFKIVNKKIS